MDTVFSIVLLVIAFALSLVVFRRDLQMLQQNSYRNNRYVNWLKMSGDASSISRIFLLAILMMLIAFPFVWSDAVASGLLLAMIVNELRKKYKKPLVFTKRVWRIYISLIVATLATLAASALVDCHFVPRVAIVISFFSYAYVIVVNRMLLPVENAINRSYVDDAKRRLAQMPDMKVIGITGSYGKTSTKHYLNRILCEKYNVLMTPGSFNTPMGVVRTVRESMQPYHDIFIAEMGAKNIGDIKEICDIVNPSIGIVTAVGPQHLESFKSIENVQRTKFELVDALPADGLAVVNDDFEFVANRKVDNVDVIRYAVHNTNNASCRAVDIEYSSHGTSFTALMPDGSSIKLQTKLVGECNISNLLAAVSVAAHLGVPAEKIRYAVSKIEQVEHRLNMKRTPGGVTIIDDAFNSNPDGARMALDVIAQMKQGKRIVITPGMIELGPRQAELNEIFGQQLANACDVAIVVGEYNREAILAGINKADCVGLKLIVADSFADAQAKLASIVAPGDTVLYENDLPDTFK